MEKHRLSAIMFTDIVGYTRKVSEDKVRMLRLLKDHNKMIESATETHNGEIIKHMGDGFLISFDSALNAVLCAIEIQQAHREYNLDKEEADQVQVRIGIHLGDIVIREDDVFGDGVNVASRVQPLAEPGGICITRAVYDIVKKKMDIKAVELGPQNLKNVAEAIEVFHLLTETIGEKEVRKDHKAKQPKRRRWIVPVVSVGVILIVLIALIMVHQGTFKSGGVQVTFVGGAKRSAISPDGKSFAYYCDNKVFVQDISDGEPIEIFSMFSCSSLRWSPDGSEILINGWKSPTQSATFLVSRLGGASRKILAGGHNTWSPDGEKIAYSYLAWKKILVVDKATGEVDTIVTSGNYRWFKDIDWSPTDNFILFLTKSEDIRTIWTISIDGKTENKVLDETHGIASPRWAPGGDAIYYFRGNDLIKIRIDPETGQKIGKPLVLLTSSQFGQRFSISESGDQLLYTRKAGCANFWTVTVKPTTDAKRLETKQFKGTHSILSASISPDGKQFAFTIRKGASANIYIMPIEGGDKKQITFLDAYCGRAVWSPDGKEIAFGSGKGGKSQVWKVNLKTGKTHRFEKTDLSESLWISWAPGQNILYQKPGNRNFSVLDPETGSEKDLIQDDSVGWIFYPVYSPDLEKLAVFWNHKKMRGLWVIPAKDSVQDEQAKPLIEGTFIFIGWSQDSDWIYAFGTSPESEQYEILIVSAEDGTVRDSIKLPFEDVNVRTMSPDCKTFGCIVFEVQSDVWVVKDFDPDLK